MSSLKVFRRVPLENPETGCSDSPGASSVRVIRDGRISDGGVTAGMTAGGNTRYSRRQRKSMSEGRFPGMRRQTSQRRHARPVGRDGTAV